MQKKLVNSPTPRVLSLCLLWNDSHILLGLKKRGFGKGRWNGFGGKVEIDESIETAAKRELYEEANLRAQKIEKIAELKFTFQTGELLLVHVYKVSAYEGELIESEEMKPQWWSITEIPYRNMWPDDLYWLPLVLKGKKIIGNFLFANENELLSHQLQIVEKF